MASGHRKRVEESYLEADGRRPWAEKIKTAFSDGRRRSAGPGLPVSGDPATDREVYGRGVIPPYRAFVRESPVGLSGR